MKDKRIKCPKCGRVLAFGCAYAAVAIECSCGHRTYLKDGRVVDDVPDGTFARGKRRRHANADM